MRIWLVAIVALLVGMVLGYVLRPMIAAPGAVGAPASDGQASQPSEAEATAAVRRFGADPLLRMPDATLTLGQCGPSKLTAGIECASVLVARPGAKPLNKLVGFARFNGRWERTY